MSDDDALRIAKALGQLAMARGGEVEDGQADVYIHDLLDQPPALVERACEALRLKPRRDHEKALPDVGTILERCEEIARDDVAVAARKMLAPPPKPDEDPRTWRYCIACDDSGWEEFWCVGTENTPKPEYRDLKPKDCGRGIPHGGHTFVKRCDCLPRNPVIARRREQDARMVTQKRGRGGGKVVPFRKQPTP